MAILIASAATGTQAQNVQEQQAVPERFHDRASDSIVAAVDSLFQVLRSDTVAAGTDTAAVSSIMQLNRPFTVNQKARRDWSTWRPDPQRALWLALVIPGGGQIYNRKYWKLPIVYGGFLGCVYALTWNGQMFNDYSKAYLDITDSDPNTKSYEKMLPPNYNISGQESRFQNIFKSKKDTFRRFRDLSIFAFGGVYLLSVIDAYVDAELSTFDLSHDLSLQIQPTMIETERLDIHHRHTTPGIQCVINF